jgi:hypothetical protein
MILKQRRDFTVDENIGREHLHKDWRESRCPHFAQNIIAESMHEEAKRPMLKKIEEEETVEEES